MDPLDVLSGEKGIFSRQRNTILLIRAPKEWASGALRTALSKFIENRSKRSQISRSNNRVDREAFADDSTGLVPKNVGDLKSLDYVPAQHSPKSI